MYVVPKLRKSFYLALAIVLTFTPSHTASAATSKSLSFQAEIWVDNWFELYVNGKKIAQDSVPITTERSFNSAKVKFTATYPFTVGVIARDYTENASGLEYIGKSNQQIGDGGFVLQIKELAKNTVIGVTDKSWKTMVINKAPLNPECVTSSKPLTDCKSQQIATPSSWAQKTFSDKPWINATEYSKDEVGVKDGYFDISWSPLAQLIWSGDLKLDNYLLLRKTFSAPATSVAKSLTVASSDISSAGIFNKDVTCDGAGRSPQISWNSPPAQTKSFLITMHSEPGPPRPGETESGNHGYFIAFNIPPTVSDIPAGSQTIGTLGQNFLGKKIGYTPPCSQGPGAKKYTITVYALSSSLSLTPQEATLAKVLDSISGKVLASTTVDGQYTRS